MGNKSLTAALLLLVASIGCATASEIYKSTDADGNVYYTDKPVADASERVEIQSRPTNHEEVQARVQTRLDNQTAVSEELAKQPPGPTDEELRAEEKERDDKCAKYQARLTKFAQSRRLYREDEEGERIYLDETETQAARNKAQDQVNEYCD